MKLSFVLPFCGLAFSLAMDPKDFELSTADDWADDWRGVVDNVPTEHTDYWPEFTPLHTIVMAIRRAISGVTYGKDLTSQSWAGAVLSRPPNDSYQGITGSFAVPSLQLAGILPMGVSFVSLILSNSGDPADPGEYGMKATCAFIAFHRKVSGRSFCWSQSDRDGVALPEALDVSPGDMMTIKIAPDRSVRFEASSPNKSDQVLGFETHDKSPIKAQHASWLVGMDWVSELLGFPPLVDFRNLTMKGMQVQSGEAKSSANGAEVVEFRDIYKNGTWTHTTLEDDGDSMTVEYVDAYDELRK